MGQEIILLDTSRGRLLPSLIGNNIVIDSINNPIVIDVDSPKKQFKKGE